MNRLPAGLTDGNIEFFSSENEEACEFVLQNGMVHPYEESPEGRKWICIDINNNSKTAEKFSKHFTLSGIELEKKWAYCRYSKFDFNPDVNTITQTFSPEYHDCKSRACCPFSGLVCKLPEGPGGILSHKEIEVVKSIASGNPAKNVADDLGVSFDTVRTQLKSAYKKVGTHNKAEITAFALQNNLI